MTNEENKGLVANRFAELDKHNFDVLDELFAREYTLHLPGAKAPLDLEQTKQLYRDLYSALPDLRHTIEDQIAEGDKVVTRWSARGTHQGELLGRGGSGNEIAFAGINIYRIADGKLIESHVSWDVLAIAHQLGLAERRGLVE